MDKWSHPSYSVGWITYPFSNFNSTTVGFWDWLSNQVIISSPFYRECDYLSTLGLKLTHVIKRYPRCIYWLCSSKAVNLLRGKYSPTWSIIWFFVARFHQIIFCSISHGLLLPQVIFFDGNCTIWNGLRRFITRHTPQCCITFIYTLISYAQCWELPKIALHSSTSIRLLVWSVFLKNLRKPTG